MEIDLVESVSEAWASTPSVRVGVVPPHLPSADRQALVSRGGTPYLRIEVYGGRDGTFAFEEVVLWSRYAVIGFGHRVHLVSLDDNSVVSQDSRELLRPLLSDIDLSSRRVGGARLSVRPNRLPCLGERCRRNRRSRCRFPRTSGDTGRRGVGSSWGMATVRALRRFRPAGHVVVGSAAQLTP